MWINSRLYNIFLKELIALISQYLLICNKHKYLRLWYKFLASRFKSWRKKSMPLIINTDSRKKNSESLNIWKLLLVQLLIQISSVLTTSGSKQNEVGVLEAYNNPVLGWNNVLCCCCPFIAWFSLDVGILAWVSFKKVTSFVKKT